MPRVRPRAGTERGIEGRPGRSPGDGSSGNKWLCRLRSRPHGSNFGGTQWARSGRLAWEKARGSGREGRRGAPGTVCAGGAALRRASGSACHRLYPHGPPAPVLATAASRCRREGLSGIHSGRGIPASCSLAANFRRAARSEEAWPARGTRGLWTSVLHPRGSLFGCAAQRSAAVGCVPGPCIVSCSEPQPPLKSAINFPSLLRPARPRASPRLLTRRAPLAAPELRPLVSKPPSVFYSLLGRMSG